MLIQGSGGHAAVVREVAILSGVESGAFIAVGDNASRKSESERLADWEFTKLIHPSAIVSPSAQIGEGTIVMAGAIVQAHARIGKHAILNSGCSVDHHCVIGDFAHIAPGVHLCGAVTVGEGALVGVGSCAVPGARIDAWTLIRAGSVVT